MQYGCCIDNAFVGPRTKNWKQILYGAGNRNFIPSVKNWFKECFCLTAVFEINVSTNDQFLSLVIQKMLIDYINNKMNLFIEAENKLRREECE